MLRGALRPRLRCAVVVCSGGFAVATELFGSFSQRSTRLLRIHFKEPS
jgi:hypothetical protein